MDSGGSVSQSCQFRESWHRNNCHQDDGTSVPMSSAYSPLLHLPSPLITRVAADTMTIQMQMTGYLDKEAADASQTVREVLGYLSDLEFAALCAGLSAGPGEGSAVC